MIYIFQLGILVSKCFNNFLIYNLNVMIFGKKRYGKSVSKDKFVIKHFLVSGE